LINKHIYYRDVNNDMMELQIIAYACKTSSARRVVGVVPYIPYSKQSKMRKRGSIVCKLLAKMLSTSGELLNMFDENICYMAL
jgi:phosphoribosylpyrophosphate synthetase